jgi:carboxymethylenebutenolidase
MGSAWAIDASAEWPDDLRAAVLFYGAGDADFAKARAVYQGHFAEADPWEPDEYVRQMESAMAAAGRSATIYRYPGVGHWFFEPDRPDAYAPEAAALAWERTLAFLRQQL